ncbi:uncharacterized protein LOC141642203 [Silene latifolia]|uniref:uncharacterized protein LOC141642203 n=1 Tax=Silene latifolia TaxID=37657 RepID=UPI003D77F564
MIESQRFLKTHHDFPHTIYFLPCYVDTFLLSFLNTLLSHSHSSSPSSSSHQTTTTTTTFMAEVTKYQLITTTKNTIFSDIKSHFSLFKTRKSSPFIYGIVLIFVIFTVFLAFSPSTSSPFTHTDETYYRSHFSSVYSYFFPNSTQINPSRSQNNVTNSQNLNKTAQISDKVENFEQKNGTILQKDDQNTQSSDLDHVAAVNNSQNLNKTQISAQITDKDENFEQKNATILQKNDQNTQSSDLDHVAAVNNSPNLNKTQISDEINGKVGNFEQKGDQNIQSSNLNQVAEVNNVTVTSAVAGNNSIVHASDQSTKLSPLQKNESSITPQISQISPNSTKNGGGMGVKSSDLAASLTKNQGKNRVNDTVLGGAKKQENEVGNLVGCDLYDGNWVKDESYPLYKPGSCNLIDEQFNCFLNGRPDADYQMLKWKPKGCTLPRLNGGQMLELLRGKRLVFVGDSLNRNMWESLVCILKNAVPDKKKVYEAFGHHNFRTEASYSFVFEDYNSTVEFFVSPFLVQQWEVTDKNGTTKETLRLDLMVRDADQFKNADYIIFNTGHWWTHDKTSKGEDYYQEGSHVYKQLDVTEAFRRAITTWGRWIDANVNPQRTHVLFRGYSASHFSGGQWNSGGQCDSETDPIRNDTYLTEYPPKMKVFESVIKGMKIPVSYLNVTKLTDYRKDGHPSVYRKLHLTDDEKQSPLKYQDCSHWCLPGVPDSWNELLYAELLRKHYKDQQHQNQT